MHSLFPPLSTLLWLIAALALVVLPHIFHLTWWILLIFFALLLWRYLITRHRWELPRLGIRLALAWIILLSVLWHYGTWFGREAGLALLVVLCGLKLLEMNSRRDAFLLSFLSYFLIITNFLYSQSIFTALYMGISLLVTTATLISLNDSHNRLPITQRLRLSTLLLIQAFPLMIVLFFLFPRITGSLWSLPKDAHSGITGLSNSLSLGNVSKLSLSNEIAFRVKFEEEIPPPQQRYWRGPVLWWTNGRDWKSGLKYSRGVSHIDLRSTSQPFDYTVTLEPHNERWLFALDLPTHAPPASYITADYQILAKASVRQRRFYRLRSYTDYQANIWLTRQARLALYLPKGKHARAQALAKQWQQAHARPEMIVHRALQYFNQEAFVYTYTPPLLLDDPIDEFLFETRQGFCEHYAAAFTVLMRAAGIPARIVTGYLGGTVNPIGNYLMVRQRDAHAWSEVWLPNRGWVRIDPTGAIAPERIEQGIDTALPNDSNPLGIIWDSDSTAIKLWQQLRNTWDAINNGWNQWILGYNPTRQQQLLGRLGLKDLDWRGMTVILTISITILLLGIAAGMLLRSPRKAPDPAQRIYQHFCRKLARRGLLRHPSEGPLTFATRVSAVRPDLADSTQKIVELYIQTRYCSQLQTLTQLRRAVQQFHP